MSDITKEIKKLDYNDYDEAKEIVRRFIDKYLHGNIDELKTFSFWNILADDEFNGGLKNGNSFDGDRTRIVYAIDYLLYHDKIPNLTLGDPKDNKDYSGDTINTFRTLFGNRFQYVMKKNGEEIVEEKFKFSPEQIDLKNDFFRVYQRIGNFYLLPNTTIFYEKAKTIREQYQSINTYRGSVSNWKDYFDVFLAKLEKCFSENINLKEDEAFLNQLIHTEKNEQFFFSYCNGYVENFLSIFFLQEYSSNLFLHEQNYYYGHSYYRSSNIDIYKNFAFDYISKATELINRRSKVIVENLKPLFK